MDLTTYRNNKPLKQALDGYIPRICEAARRDGIKISPNTLRRHCQEFKAEFGASFWAKTKAVSFYLSKFSRARFEFLISDLFASLPERARRLWKREEWLERVFERIGEFQANVVCGRWDKANVGRFELSELLRAEIV